MFYIGSDKPGRYLMGDKPTNQFFFIERYERLADKLRVKVEAGQKLQHPMIVNRSLEGLQMSINMHAGKEVERWSIKKFALTNSQESIQGIAQLADPLRYQQTIDLFEEISQMISELITVIPFATYIPDGDGTLN